MAVVVSRAADILGFNDIVMSEMQGEFFDFQGGFQLRPIIGRATRVGQIDNPVPTTRILDPHTVRTSTFTKVTSIPRWMINDLRKIHIPFPIESGVWANETGSLQALLGRSQLQVGHAFARTLNIACMKALLGDGYTSVGYNTTGVPIRGDIIDYGNPMRLPTDAVIPHNNQPLTKEKINAAKVYLAKNKAFANIANGQRPNLCMAMTVPEMYKLSEDPDIDLLGLQPYTGNKTYSDEDGVRIALQIALGIARIYLSDSVQCTNATKARHCTMWMDTSTVYGVGSALDRVIVTTPDANLSGAVSLLAFLNIGAQRVRDNQVVDIQSYDPEIDFDGTNPAYHTEFDETGTEVPYVNA